MNNDVKRYIEAQGSPQKEICKKLREIIVRTFPEITEEMKWGVSSYGKGEYYFVALKDHVNLGFSLKGLSKEEIAFFEGAGKTMRHIKIYSLDEIDEKKVVHLLKLVHVKGSERGIR
jgi:hypothetical protein